MTTKVKGTEGVEFPDASVQSSAAYTKAESKGPAFSVQRTGSGAQLPSVSSVVYMNGTTDYVELYGYVQAASGGNFEVDYTRMSGALLRRT